MELIKTNKSMHTQTIKYVMINLHKCSQILLRMQIPLKVSHHLKFKLDNISFSSIFCLLLFLWLGCQFDLASPSIQSREYRYTTLTHIRIMGIVPNTSLDQCILHIHILTFAFLFCSEISF